MKHRSCVAGLLMAWLSVPVAGTALVGECQSCPFDCEGVPEVAGGAISLELVSDRLSRPVDVTAAPGDTERIFVVQQRGLIRIIRLGEYGTPGDDVLLPTPFLDLRALVSQSGNERGLLGLAFHPQHSENGFFYVNYTKNRGSVCQLSPPPGCLDSMDSETVVARYRVSGDNPDVADPGSAQIVLTFCQPFSNHNGGQVVFGPNDGHLYISTGDGGSGGDPCNSGQNLGSFLGKLLRVDVDADDFPADANRNYAVPPDNPFVGIAGALPEIWALGLRNPWRISFDPANGDLYIADVGQNAWEEIDYQPASSPGGENYGWRRLEGDHNFVNPRPSDPYVGSVTGKVFEYPHRNAAISGCSVTGGHVYRGCRIPSLRGRYLFADYCSHWVRSFRIQPVPGQDGEFEAVDPRNHTAELNGGILPDLVDDISAFGVDGRGEMYICDLSTKLYRIVPTPTLPEFRRADANEDGMVDISDGVSLLVYLFLSGGPPTCHDAADADDNGSLEVTDAIFTFEFLFLGGEPPPLPGSADCGPDATAEIPELGCESYDRCDV